MIKILLRICFVWLALCLQLGLQANAAGISTVTELRQQAAQLQQLRKYDQAIVMLEEAIELLKKQSPQDNLAEVILIAKQQCTGGLLLH